MFWIPVDKLQKIIFDNARKSGNSVAKITAKCTGIFVNFDLFRSMSDFSAEKSSPTNIRSILLHFALENVTSRQAISTMSQISWSKCQITRWILVNMLLTTTNLHAAQSNPIGLIHNFDLFRMFHQEKSMQKWLKTEWNYEISKQCNVIKIPCWSAEVSNKRLRSSYVSLMRCWACVDDSLRKIICLLWAELVNIENLFQNLLENYPKFFFHSFGNFNFICFWIYFLKLQKTLIPIDCEPAVASVLVIPFSNVSFVSPYSYADVVVSFWHSCSHLSFAVFSIARKYYISLNRAIFSNIFMKKI